MGEELAAKSNLETELAGEKEAMCAMKVEHKKELQTLRDVAKQQLSSLAESFDSLRKRLDGYGEALE